MNYTSIEQSKKLLELRLSPRTADMCYPRELYDGEIELPVVVAEWIEVDWTKNLPCWSVGALLEIIPQYHIYSPYPNEDNYICWSTYFNLIDMECAGKSLIEAVYNYIIWLLENNYIKKEK